MMWEAWWPMVSALDSGGSSGPRWSPASGTVLCSWAIIFTLIVPLFTQVYQWVSVNLMLCGNRANIPFRGEGVEILLIAS